MISTQKLTIYLNIILLRKLFLIERLLEVRNTASFFYNAIEHFNFGALRSYVPNSMSYVLHVSVGMNGTKYLLNIRLSFAVTDLGMTDSTLYVHGAYIWPIR